MNETFKKCIGILSNDDLEKLSNSLVLIFGLGGVGGYLFETLIRTGVSNFIIVDKDKFEITNLNRQLASNIDNIGSFKVKEYKDRALKINNKVKIIDISIMINEDNIDKPFELINEFKDINNVFVADCIDDVSAKLQIIKKCKLLDLELISSMGTANHINSNFIKIDFLSKTKYCPLAKKIRYLLRDNKELNPVVLYIEEEPIDISVNKAISHTSTVQFIPAISGMKMAEYIIKNILKFKTK